MTNRDRNDIWTAAARAQDLKMLDALLDDHAHELTEDEYGAFDDMRADLQCERYHRLTEKRRAWVTRVHERVCPTYTNEFSRGLIPMGAEVKDPPALQHRPLKPPTRRPQS